MPSPTFDVAARIKTLSSVLSSKNDLHLVETGLHAADGDMAATLESLKGKLSPASLKKVSFAHSLAEWTDDNAHLMKAVAAQANVTSLRDVALHFDAAKLATLVQHDNLPSNTVGATHEEKVNTFATTLQNKLFVAESSAVLQRMVRDAELPIADANVRTGINHFLNNQPDFNIRTTSVYHALKNPEAFKDIAGEHQAEVVEHIKTLQRLTAISHVPDAVPALMKANITSGLRVAELPEPTFMRTMSGSLGEADARQVYTNAINGQIRNEQALMTMREELKGHGLAIMGGQPSQLQRTEAMQKLADKNGVPLNLSTLFGSLDYCECDDCLSVYSPAAYFVELLQYLRNNDLGPDPIKPDSLPKDNPKIHPGIAGTPLEKLFRRRPDLGCLELTCDNTFTVLPYIDLVNEVMESFVVHLGDYHNDTNDPKQATLEAFNVEGETSSELLAIPQHVNYEAYCILKSAVYPFTLPYHQPIDATRIFLNYLGTSRWELLDTFRTPTESFPGTAAIPGQLQELKTLHQTVIDNAVDADFLGMTQEEYIILTHEAFWPKSYFDLTQNKVFSVADYEMNIGVRQVCEYYGYSAPSSGTCDADMLSTDETAQVGLTFVKQQFLPRTGIEYIDLVELLKTHFINPNFPQGRALKLLESIRFSYRFLQTLVDTSSKEPKLRFAKLVDFLEKTQPVLPLIDALLHPDPCKQQQCCAEIEVEDVRSWVYCYFERIGKLIVLESGEGPSLAIFGDVYTDLMTDKKRTKIGVLQSDGLLSDLNNKVVGQVDPAGVLIFKDSSLVQSNSPHLYLLKGGEPICLFDPINTTFQRAPCPPLTWLPPKDTCDLNKVRLLHLDGTSVTINEYDRLQRFIRLWRKIGWSVDETDKALSGLVPMSRSAIGLGSSGLRDAATSTDSEVSEVVGFDTFNDDCVASGGAAGCCDDGTDEGPKGNTTDGCPEFVEIDYTINPAFLHQLRAIKMLLDRTGLTLPKLLVFWADISTVGEKSLYAKLFLTHNLLGIDKVFAADANGNYLTQPAKITDHMPVLMATLKLKADDIAAIMGFASIADTLTLRNVSVLYRYSLLAKILHVRVPLLKDVLALFGDPFASAWSTLRLLDTWGQMEDAGFTFRQLNYLIQDRDDSLRPLAPTQRKILQLAKTMFDGLNAIDRDHKDITDANKADATIDLVRAKASLLFDAAVVEKISSLLEGTTVYVTNAPTGLTLDKEAIGAKLKYSEQKDISPATAAIQVTGILTDSEIVSAKALSNKPEWSKAIDRIGKQAKNVFNDVLFGIFLDTAEAQKQLLQGDFSNPADLQDAANTAPQKRFYFLQVFLPFLRERLSQQLVTSTCATAASLPTDVTNILLSDILHVGTPPVSGMKTLESIKSQPAGAPAGWQGYLIPTADADYTFVAIGDTQPAALQLEGQSIQFTLQQEDPSNVWSSDPTTPAKLKSGKLYWLQLADRPAEELLWKTSISPSTKIPSSSLLPDFSSQATKEILTALCKAALLVNGFNLSADEVSYWQNHATDFDGFDFNGITLQHWQRLQAYANLRNNLPRTDVSLLDLFKWANKPDDPAKLSAKIAAATTWKVEAIDKLIAPDASDLKNHFDLNRPNEFCNEVNLVKLGHAIEVADKIAVDIDRLFDWAKPGSKFWACHQIAEDVRKAMRARFDETDWEQVVKPLNDQLRENQKNALISYLLVQQDLIDWGVVDADSLFEFFLIDVQMDACMETSRIKQAISSVQLFIQRCLLGLEEKKDAKGNEVGVTNDALDRDRWNWMQRYRVWEANRKVFLYPENWLKSELRDDKSPFYKELESELLQKDVSPQTVEDALKNYLFKVDEVANLKVVGLFVDPDKPNAQHLHVFARTRNAPFLFYYRRFDVAEKNWYPWEKMQVDIPAYDVEDKGSTKILDNGSYVIPTVWNGRLLVFLPQFVKKTSTDVSVGEYWEIKLGWSEYRNKKWTQKQVSADAVYSFVSPGVVFSGAIDLYSFVPRAVTAPDNRLLVEVYFNANNDIGKFAFTGNHLFVDPTALTKASTSAIAHFQVFHADKSLHSYQATGKSAPALVAAEPFFVVDDVAPTGHLGGPVVEFSHPFIRDLINAVSTGGLDELFGYLSKQVASKSNAFGGYLDADGKPGYAELKAAYSIYNWEAGFHAPMLLATRFANALQFERAIEICHHVMNPYAAGAPTDALRFWQFWPFTQVAADNVIENLFLSLKPGTPNAAINEWRNKPFQPHVVARGRPSAYMKWVAMTYIRILIEWGDYLFRQDTIETINQATQLYVLAAHVYGPRGQKIPKRGKVLPKTYNALLDKWDAFGNAMVELELAFPFSNQTSLPVGSSNGVVGLANIFGFATTLYFCIPDNPELMALRDTIDDRLFKIRHCENIAGVFRKLPLFEPPINPDLLVDAIAQGLSLSNVLNDLNSPMPNYRFNYLLQKALEMCNELKVLGNAFLAAKEKGDAEAVSRLRATHETSIQNLVMEVKKLQLAEAEKSLEALQQSRKGPEYRLRHYLALIGDASSVPGAAAEFKEIADQIEPPTDESGLRLIAYEKEEMDKAAEANDKLQDVGVIEVLAGIMHAIPNLTFPITPAVTSSFGGTNLGSATQAVARSNQIVAGNRSFSSTNAGRKANFLRQLQDRVQQANVAGYEIKNIDKQSLTQQIRINITQQEITTQQKAIDNAQEMDDFLRNKYTNQELYGWMESQVRTLYHQAYSLAYDLAKRAEKVFCFERGLSASSFIQYGYWDPAYDGLLAGERLYVGLKQLEAAYQEKRGHDFEISKSISLRQLSPLALLQLKQTGKCEFALPEVLFDMDYAGHYLRRIKSIALTVPCIVGPYTSMNCTLRLLEHKFRSSARCSDKSDYVEKTDETDDRFCTVNVPIASIAASTGQNDSGLFELNFHDERYLPFEGAGAISKWSLDLPEQFRQLDYDTITDVILHVRYTAVDGGNKLKKPAADSVKEYVKSIEELSRDQGLFAFFDVARDFSNEWYKAKQLVAGATERTLTLSSLNDHLPIFTKGRKPEKLTATDIYLFTAANLTASKLTLMQGTDESIVFNQGPSVGTMRSFVAHDASVPIGNWQLKIQDTTTALDDLQLVARYVLT